jgi:phenylpyruvate tautomerase PptA (4-oxalocrotonate tautomerase family)
MPFVRVFVPQNLTDAQIEGISEAIHQSLVDEFKVPVADRFQAITRHSPEQLVCTPEYLGVKHGSQVAFIQVTDNEGRTVEMKKALFAAIASAIDKTGAIAAADVIITLLEVKKENWSFGNGIAQYAL